MRARSIARMCCTASIVVSRRPRSWPCLDWGAPPYGARAWPICKVESIWRCSIWRAPAGRASTARAAKRGGWGGELVYRQGGIDLAVFDLARPGRPRQYGTDDEARVMALACSAPPAGQKRWTLAQLECAARQEPGLGRMGRETVRRILRKTTANPGAG